MLTPRHPLHKLQPVNRTERLLDLITYLLNAREPVSWQEIKNHFPEDYDRGVEESNQRKFERDKAELISLGIPIGYLGGVGVKKEGYVIDKERLFLPEIAFTPEESSLLMLSAGAVLENEGFPYRDQLESALHKIISLQSQINQPPAEITITYAGGKKSPPRSTWVHDIQDALDRRKTIEILYHAFSTGETIRRRVNPYGLVFRRGAWTLIGWDHLRQGIRSFVLNRIKNLTVNARKPGTPDYSIPEDFFLRQYVNQEQWELEFHEPMPATVRVSRHRLPELLPQLTSATRHAEDTFQLEVTNKAGLISWLLSQKTDVQLLDPPEILDEIRRILQEVQ